MDIASVFRTFDTLRKSEIFLLAKKMIYHLKNSIQKFFLV